MIPPLPPQPNLENLRKRAKSLLKAHRAGDVDACPTLRLLSRFRASGDGEILTARVSLQEAQHALAIDHGFKSWKQLADHVRSLARFPAGRPAEDDEIRRPFGETEAWEAVRGGVEDVQRLPAGIRSQVVSITVAGSLVRGDFLDNRSDVDIYTVYAGSVEKPWTSEAHARVRSCIDRHFSPFKGSSANPFVWDDVCIGQGSLPRTPDDFARQRFKALGIYYFDFLKHHRTVWGEDFTRSMPEPVDPRPLAPARLASLLAHGQSLMEAQPAEQMRLTILTGGAITALQIYYGPEPSIHKSEVIRRYERFVPDFPEKPFGLQAWREYLAGEIRRDGLGLPAEDYLAFLAAATETVREHVART